MKKDAFLMFQVIKKYISRKEKLKSSAGAIDKLIDRFNEEIKIVITDAGKLAKKNKRKTILPRHMEAALEKNLGKTGLSWKELLDEFLKQKPTDLGKISEGISIYLRKQKK